jgi:DNA-binding transcriptional regulator YiaG
MYWMKADEFRRIRTKFEMNQDDFSDLLGLSGKKVVSSIETGARNPSKLTAIILGVLDGLPKRKAKELVELMLEQGNKEK